MNNSAAQRQEEMTTPEGAVSELESLLRKYEANRTVSKDLGLEKEIGVKLGSMILENQTSARETLNNFTAVVPTEYERTMQSKTINLDETTREAAGPILQFHLVKAQKQAEGDLAILVTNDHMRISVYMSTIQVLMENLHGLPYSEYQQFRDTFTHKMHEEIRENDKKLKQMTSVQKAGEATTSEEQKTSRQKTEEIDVLTFGHFTKRLENTIVNMATMKVATDSNQ